MTTVGKPYEFIALDTTLTDADISYGMLVEIADLAHGSAADRRKYGGVWKVRTITPPKSKNGHADLIVVNPMGTELRSYPYMLKRTDLPWTEVEAADVVMGSVVRWKDKGVLTRVRGAKATDLLVVVNVKGNDVKLARLGGTDGNRAWPTIPRTWLSAVHGEQVTIP
jgi:hypothetical protein